MQSSSSGIDGNSRTNESHQYSSWATVRLYSNNDDAVMSLFDVFRYIYLKQINFLVLSFCLGKPKAWSQKLLSGEHDDIRQFKKR